LQNIEIIIK